MPVEKEIDGRMETVYLDEIGKPLKWFHHDPEKLLDTAYIGCSKCEKELDRETLDAGHYVCRKTNLKALDLCKKALEEQKIVESVALRAPRLACVGFNPARQIRKLVSDRTKNRVDEIQQGLGKPFSLTGGRIKLERLQEASRILPFKREPDFVVMGIDQGKAEHWGIIQKWYLGKPEDYPEDNEMAWFHAKKEVVWYGNLNWGEIDDLVKAWEIDLGTSRE